MATFTDNQGRAWAVSVDINAARRVRARLSFDLLDVQEGMSALARDPILLVDVLYVVCKPQADERSVSKEGFGDLFVGDVTVDAVKGLVQGLLDFFPSDRRALIERLWKATQRAHAEAVKMATGKLDSPLIEQALEGAIQKASDEIDQQLTKFGETSGNSPGSSELTPAP